MPVESAPVVAEAGYTVWLVTGVVTASGWALIAILAGVMLLVSRVVTRRIERFGAAAAESARLLHDLVRKIVLTVAVLGGLALAGGAVWLAWNGTDPWLWGLTRVREISPAVWGALGLSAGKLVIAGIVLAALVRLVRRLLVRLEAAINAWDSLEDNDKSLARFFAGLDRAVVVAAWLGFATIATWLFTLPEWCTTGLAAITRIYAIVTVGLLVLRATAVVVDTCNGVSRRYAEKRGWIKLYEHLRPLVPLLRRCLELVLYLGIASLVLHELPTLDALASYGPLLIQVIGIFFIGRVVIEVGNLLIGHWMIGGEGLDDLERRRRATIVPLARSLFRAGCWFAIVVLGLTVLGFNTWPFLAGISVLGMVFGFGAQSLISDVVSGFFILFENVYLVGDVIEAAGAKGTVEAIEFRTTKIRDNEGRLHIVRNGDVKQVVNYSREFTCAVVSFEVGYEVDLKQVFATVTSCGKRLKAEDPDVLAPAVVDGISDFAGSTLKIRVLMRVRPGRHEQLAARLRLLLKETFDQAATAGAARKGLVPA